MADTPIEVRSDSLEKTCPACPSQWSAETLDGEYVYVRYRWGSLRIDVSPSKEAWPDQGETVFKRDIGGSLDGTISWDEVKDVAPIHEFKRE
jgi:hypothetical protein